MQICIYGQKTAFYRNKKSPGRNQDSLSANGSSKIMYSLKVSNRVFSNRPDDSEQNDFA